MSFRTLTDALLYLGKSNLVICNFAADVKALNGALALSV